MEEADLAVSSIRTKTSPWEQCRTPRSVCPPPPGVAGPSHVSMASGGSTGHPHQPEPHCHRSSSPAPLHNLQTSPPLCLSHLSTTYLFMVVAPSCLKLKETDCPVCLYRFSNCFLGSWRESLGSSWTLLSNLCNGWELGPSPCQVPYHWMT